MLQKRLIGKLLFVLFFIQLLPLRQVVQYLQLEDETAVEQSPVNPTASSGEYSFCFPGLAVAPTDGFSTERLKPAETIHLIHQCAAEVDTPPPNAGLA